MLARLGDVLFWAGCLFGGVAVIAGLVAPVSYPHQTADNFLVGLGVGIVSVLVGLAAKYVLTNPAPDPPDPP